jgi:alkylation response protein AidB-like acyl-CoA dehydrogenase
MTTPTHSNLMARADALAALVNGRSREFESLCHLPPDVVQAMAASGLLRLLTPAEIGGFEVPVASYFALIERLARADASLAWCSFISSTSCVLAAYLPKDASEALFSLPALKAAGVFAPRGQARPALQDGVAGYRVSGRWFWGSGARHADLINGGCLVIGADGKPQTQPDGSPRVLSVVFERALVTVLDNWDTLGLRGSGSGEFEVTDVFVPADRCACLLDAPRVTTPLYRFPVFGLLALAIAAVASGVARRAIDELIALASDKVPQASSKTLASRPATQEAVARAEAQWRGARAFVMEAIGAAWDAAQHSEGISVAQRADLRLAATHTVHTAAAVVQRAYTVAGGTAVFADSPLQRCLRDVSVATQHMMVGESSWELTGRVKLGLPTAVGML